MTKPDAAHGGTMVTRFLAVVVSVVLCGALAWADEAPISGTVTAVDAGAQTVTLESTAKGKTRQVVVHLKPGLRSLRPSACSTKPVFPGSEERANLTIFVPGLRCTTT